MYAPARFALAALLIFCLYLATPVSRAGVPSRESAARRRGGGGGGGEGGCQTPVFFPASAVDATTYPAELVLADMTSDGIDDLVVSYDDGTVGVMPGDGDGDFGPSIFASAGVNAEGVRVADFNEDGDLDVAVLLDRSGVRVLFGDGAGGLTGGPTLALLSSAFVVGDFNGDGHVDIVADRYSVPSVAVFLGDGTGSFSGPTFFSSAAASTAHFLETADLDEDGDLDLVITDDLIGSYSVLLGDGAGGFGAPAAAVTIGGHLSRFVIVDLDGDANLDLAISDYSEEIRVLLGNGDGTFGPAATFAAVQGGTGIAVADLNRDSIPDIALTNYSSNTVAVVLGDGTGAFGSPTLFPSSGQGPVVVRARDVNGDGAVDLIVANHLVHTISVFLNACGTGCAITCPADVRRSAASPSGAVVTYATPAASPDNCPGATVSCSPASGSTFPIGTTSVTCTATNAGGPVARCSFSVTVSAPPFDLCFVDDFTGDTYRAVTAPGPSRGYWELRRVGGPGAADDVVYFGVAEKVSPASAKIITLDDTNDPTYEMHASASKLTGVAQAIVKVRATNRTSRVRDGNYFNSVCP